MTTDSPDVPSAPGTGGSDVVVYYKSDGYTMAGDRLMGRQSAGASFLAGLARHARSRDLVCMAPDRASAEEFADTTREAAQNGPRPLRSARWVSFDAPERLAETGCLFYPSPTIADQAWLRRAHDQRAWSLCGITHTTASDTVMEAIGSFATSPLQPWDAIICTSQAVRDTLAGVLDEWGDYLESRLGAPVGTGRKAVTLQLPVIPLGIDTASFEPDPAARATFRATYDIADDAVAALFLGRLSATAKAHPLPMFLGLQAAQAETGRAVHLILAGWFETDAERKQIEYLAREACPDVPVHIVDGRDADMRRQAWSAADLFPSLSDNVQETFGLTPIEAMATGLPVVVAAPLLGLMLNMDATSLVPLVAALALGTPTLTLVGAIGAALVLGARRGGVLVSLLVLPLYIPVLIFGVAAVDAAIHDFPVRPHLLIEAAILLAALALAPWACAGALRHAAE